MVFVQMLCSLLIILTLMCLVENRSYNNGLIFYNMANQQIYLPPTISVSRGRGLAKFKYSPRGSIWSTFGKPCDCAGPLCGCCVGMKVKQYNFDQKICANVTYAPVKDEIQLEVILNDTSTAKYGIAARDPSPLCIPIMMGVPMSMCVQMSNVGLQGDNLNMCMDFMVRLGSSDLFEMHFQCMQVGLQGASWVGPNGQPVIPPSGGKLKDTSRDESEEYYDESATVESAENEIISKEKEMHMNSAVIENADNMGNEDDLNKAEEEFDYNDITEKIVETVNEQLKESELMLDNDAINNENIEEVPKIPENVVSEDNKVSEEMGISKDQPALQAIQESEMFQMMENNIVPVQPNSMEAFGTELTEISATENDHLVNSSPEDSMDTQSNVDKQAINEIKETAADHMEILENENINNSKDELNFESIPEKIVDQIKLNSKEENTSENDIQTEINMINLPESETNKDAIDKEMLSFITEPYYDEEEETQTIEKFEMSKTEHDSNNVEQMNTSENDIQTEINMINLPESETNKDAMDIEMPPFITEPYYDEEEETHTIDKLEMSKTEHDSNNVEQMNTSGNEIQTEINLINLTDPERTKDAMQMEMLPFTTKPNSDEKEETQTVEKFEMLVNLNEIGTTELSKTEHDSNNSLEALQQAVDTSTVAENFKPTLTPAANVPATTSKIANDSIDNALTTASIMTSTTTTTTTSTMKMPYLSAAENANVPATFNENNQNDNDVHRNGEDDDDDNNDRIDNHGDDNSHENDSDYDDEEESEEYEDETTEKAIETNDAATTTKTSMSIATNVLNNDNKIIESNKNATKTTTTTNENDKANTANSNESISNKENENEEEEEEDDSKEIHTESDEYEDEEYEDYDTATVAASDTITHSLLHDTRAVQVDKSNSTNKAQMSHTNTMTIINGSNALDVTTTSSQMPQFYAIPSSTATTAKTNTISSMTTAMPLPLARKIFAFHQHKQRQFQQQQQHQRHTHSHRYYV